jgi:hypothetical protein
MMVSWHFSQFQESVGVESLQLTYSLISIPKAELSSLYVVTKNTRYLSSVEREEERERERKREKEGRGREEGKGGRERERKREREERERERREKINAAQCRLSLVVPLWKVS